VDANFLRLAMNYANVRLENTGPVHFRSTKNSLEIDPVTLRGTDTNLQIAGSFNLPAPRRELAPQWSSGPATSQRFCV